MNERIKELAKQAEIFIGKDSYGIFAVIPGHEKGPLNRQGKAESYDALEKFAELIVKECTSICAKQAWESRTNDDWTEYNALSRVAGQIKKHFGVDE